MSTQITKPKNYNVNNMVFSDPIKNTKPIKYQRIMIKTKYKNGVGDLILPTTRLYSFGLRENLKLGTQEVNGYSLPICMWGKDECTPEQKQWTDTYYNIIQKCKQHLVKVKEDIGESYLDLKQLNNPKIFSHPMAWKEENKAKGMGPILNTKLITSRKQQKYNGIITMFYDKSDQSIDPFTLLQKGCFVNAAVKIESIFIGQKMSLQVKLYNCVVELPDSGIKRLLKVESDEPSDVEEEEEPNPLLVEESQEDAYQSEEEKEEVKPKRRGRGRKKTSK